MEQTRHAIGIDISTQSVTAILIGVVEDQGNPSELMISSAWIASRPCRDEVQRKSPAVWVRLVRECVDDLRRSARETDLVTAIGVSATFPAVFPILSDGSIDPGLVSLYDNTEDAGACGGRFDDLLGRAERQTLNRMWPGNMAIGVAHLVRDSGLNLADTAAIVPGSSAFAWALARTVDARLDPSSLPVDYTQASISGLYDVRTGRPVPTEVAGLLESVVPGIDAQRLPALLPQPVPSWRNALPEESVRTVGGYLGLPRLAAVSIGAGDSPLGVLALMGEPDTIINVRGSSDSPLMPVPDLRDGRGPRETVLHYPLPSAGALADAPWCVVAPMLRSGRVWDWVKSLRFAADDSRADAELEAMATAALKKRLSAAQGALEREPLLFAPSLGGERAPDWDSRATGSLKGLLASQDLGDIALASLEGMSVVLARCLAMMEERYDLHPRRLLLAGGPTRNRLWNWVTQVFTAKEVLATTFSDASLLGAAMLGYAAGFDGTEPDGEIRQRLLALSRVVSDHPLVKGVPVAPPDEDLAGLETDYAQMAASIRAAV